MKRHIVKLLKKAHLFPIIKRIKLWINPGTRNMMIFYRQFIRPGEICFDIGANTGNRTEIFWGLGAKVIIVEPQPKCIDILKKQFSDHRCVIVPKAVAEKEGLGDIAIATNNSVISTMSKEWQENGRFSRTESWDTKISIPTTTLDNLIKQYGLPTFCKIDVEGYEKEVLAGLTKPIPCISFEFTQEFIETAIANMNYISSLSKTEFNYSIAESHTFALKEWTSKDELVLILKEEMRGKTDLWGDVYVRSQR